MGPRRRRGSSGLAALALLLGGLACGDRGQPNAGPTSATGGAGGREAGGSGGHEAGSGGTPGGTGGQAGAPGTGGGDGDASTTGDAQSTPATDAAGDLATPPAPVDAGAQDATPAADTGGGGPPPPPGPFPLDAVKAAKPALYLSAGTHLEGPSWRNGELFFAADGGGWGLMRVDANRKLYRYYTQLQPIGTYALADGSLLVCDHKYLLAQVFKDGSVATLPTTFEGQDIENCNDVAVDGPGNIYVSARHSGAIFRISPAGEVVKVLGGLDLPNGVEVDPASKYLYFNMGTGGAGRVLRLLLPTSGASFGAPEPVGQVGQPDGMQFDAWGNLWVAGWSANALVIFAPDNKVLASLSASGAINLTFGGPELDTIYLEEDFKGLFKIGPIPGLRGFLHPGAAKYTIKKMLDLTPANQPAP